MRSQLLAAAPVVDHVVLLDDQGRPTATAPKSDIHTESTPLHLAFSCHVVDADGRVLLTRRAATKPTWPSTWTNACCGHPRLGETLREAVVRRLGEELGVTARRLALAIPDFTYRAVMDDGTVEHELCPVVVAEVDGPVDPDPAEVEATAWLSWSDVRLRATAAGPAGLSPWSVRQIESLAELAPSPLDWLDRQAGRPAPVLDRPVTTRPRLEPLPGTDALTAATERVEACLDAFLRDELVVDDDPGRDLAAAIASLVTAGGKRLRPSFVWWGHAAAGGVEEDAAVFAGAAMELLHSFALIHDDVMDRSATRRGMPAAHVGLRDGRDRWFGVSAAILAGDLAFVWSDELLDRCDPPRRARQIFHRLRREVIGGQYLDLQAATGNPTERAARRVALLKTARYTVTRPLQLGAAIAGGPPELDEVLQRYGDAIGVAFQLRDDLLGVFGDPDATGKGCLDDLREGKRTLLVVRALGLADRHQREAILDALGDPILDEERAGRCRDAIAATGARASIEALIAALRDEAMAAVDDLQAPAGAADALRQLAAMCTDRRR